LAKWQAKRGYLVHFLRLLAVHWPARAHPVHGSRATMARGVLMYTEERTRTRTHVQTIHIILYPGSYVGSYVKIGICYVGQLPIHRYNNKYKQNVTINATGCSTLQTQSLTVIQTHVSQTAVADPNPNP